MRIQNRIRSVWEAYDPSTALPYNRKMKTMLATWEKGDNIMLYFAFLLDEDKIKDEKKYDLEEMYKCIDDIYGELQGKLIFTRDCGELR